jgi:hypothetical protein
MWRLLNLLLPALVPSWRFFKSVEASPRVQWTLDPVGISEQWQEFRPRPERVSALQMIVRLFWNPIWNESLFLVSCAERIQQEPTGQSIWEIRERIWADLNRISDPQSVPEALRFRLVFVQREGSTLVEQVVFQSSSAE